METLINRFKEMRRPPKSKSNSSDSIKVHVKREVKRSPGISKPLSVLEIPAGEDSVSFERHNRVLRTEWTKSNRNAMLVEQLMDRTFAMRRRDILDTSTDVQTILAKYPFLQDPEQVTRVLLTSLQ